MVSFQASSSPSRGKTINDFENPSKKRKWEDSVLLDMETPLPLDWQRCLDIQSGQIYFYNTRTKKKISEDPKTTSEPRITTHGDDHRSLDLELNLRCYSLRRNQDSNNHNSQDSSLEFDYGRNAATSNDRKNSGGLSLTIWPSWLASEKDDHQEMVATVCMKCHMLVMLCKSSPTCPNCKFMHPLDQSPPFLFKRKCSFLY